MALQAGSLAVDLTGHIFMTGSDKWIHLSHDSQATKWISENLESLNDFRLKIRKAVE